MELKDQITTNGIEWILHRDILYMHNEKLEESGSHKIEGEMVTNSQKDQNYHLTQYKRKKVLSY